MTAQTGVKRKNDEESLKVAVVVGAVGLGHVHAAHRQTHAVQHVAARRHALVYPVQTLRLLKTADLMLRGETTDSWREEGRERWWEEKWEDIIKENESIRNAEERDTRRGEQKGRREGRDEGIKFNDDVEKENETGRVTKG